MREGNPGSPKLQILAGNGTLEVLPENPDGATQRLIVPIATEIVRGGPYEEPL
jgi:hypothetical protein